MIITVGKNGAIPLPDELCAECELDIGDLLLCSVMEDNFSIQLEKFEDQTLSDTQIEAHGYLIRIQALHPKNFE